MKIGLPGPVSLVFLVFLVFLVSLALKLTGYLAWSWWWVTAPLWGAFLLVAAFVFGFAALDVLVKSDRKP